MVGVTELGAAWNGLKGAMDIAKGLNALADSVALNEAKIALQTIILDVQQSLMAAQEARVADERRIADLQQEIARLRDWGDERQRYHMVDVWRGCMVYMPKPGLEQGEPAHWLCPTCFGLGRKSVMQFKGQHVLKSGHRGDEATFACDTCKASIVVGYRTKPTYPGQTPA